MIFVAFLILILHILLVYLNIVLDKRFLVYFHVWSGMLVCFYIGLLVLDYPEFIQNSFVLVWWIGCFWRYFIYEE